MARKRSSGLFIAIRGKKRPTYWRIYRRHRDHAKERGISFLLTYEEWSTIWCNSGHLTQRGKRRNQYVMSRPGDKGPYSVDNVRIVLAGDNIRECFKGKPLTEEHKLKISKIKRSQNRKHTDETKRKMRLRLLGHVVSAETRAKISRASSRPLSKTHRANIAKAKKGVQFTEAHKKHLSEARYAFLERAK